MKITVLGHWGAYPKAGDATAGYLLEHGPEKILIDCGSGVLSRLQSHIELTQLTAVFITHSHYDHIADLGCLQYACLIDTDLKRRTKPLPVYLATESPDSGHTYRSMPGSSVHFFNESDSFHFQDLEFTFLRTFHGAYCLAVKAKAGDQTMVYTADTCYDETLIPFCRKADLLIAETSFYAEFNARDYWHMNSTEVGLLSKKAAVKKVALTHLPHFGELDQLGREVKEQFDGEVILCVSGLEFHI